MKVFSFSTTFVERISGLGDFVFDSISPNFHHRGPVWGWAKFGCNSLGLVGTVREGFEVSLEE